MDPKGFMSEEEKAAEGINIDKPETAASEAKTTEANSEKSEG